MGNGFLCDAFRICPAQVAPASAPMVGATDKTTTRKLTKEEAAKIGHCLQDLSTAKKITIQEPQQPFFNKTYLMKIEHEPEVREYSFPGANNTTTTQRTDYCAVTKRTGHDSDFWQLSTVITSKETAPKNMTSSLVRTGDIAVQKTTWELSEPTKRLMELADKSPDIKQELADKFPGIELGSKSETKTEYKYCESHERDCTPSNQAKYEEVQKSLPHFEGDKLIMEKQED